jgi:hypothetical protein
MARRMGIGDRRVDLMALVEYILRLEARIEKLEEETDPDALAKKLRFVVGKMELR